MKKKNLNQFIIHFAGLKEGLHQFEFDINKLFFQNFETSEITNAAIQVKVKFDKKTTLFDLRFSWNGTVEVVCDRCYESFDMPIKGEEMLVVKFGEEDVDNSDEIVVLPHSETKIDLAQHIYEFLSLSVPLRRIHGEQEGDDSKCNEKTIAILDQIETEEFIEEDKPIDPRWEILKRIK